MENKIIEEVRKFVEEECKRNPTGQGDGPFVFHFVPMRNCAVKLADQNGADLEIVEIAAWLHDIGSIVNGRDNHHVTGAEIAEKKLKEFGYPEEKIELVKKCILNHRGSLNNNRESIEEQIIAEADTIACFDDVPGIFQAAFVWEGNNSREEVVNSVRKKLIRKYNQLSEEGKKLIKPKYEAAMLLFGKK